MSFRYRLLALTAEQLAEPESLFLSIMASDEEASRYSLNQWAAVLAHLRVLGAQSFLVQSKVRDPDFLAEHDAFYAKQHREVFRHCFRIHAFSVSCDEPGSECDDEKRRVLAFVDCVEKDAYLGFVTLRPLRHAPIGPTILKDSPSTPSLAKDRFPVHVAGVEFSVFGTPFMQQDDAVGACAQAAIWMALRTLRRRAGNTAYSPAELTLAGTRLDRISPGRHALNIKQMLDAIQASGHDPLFVSVPGGDDARASNGEKPKLADPMKVLEAVQPYVYSGVPVILIFRNPTMPDVHAAVAIGQVPQVQNPEENCLVIHNDNAGPYQLLPNRTGDDATQYALDQVISLIVPLPHGVVMTAADALDQAQAAVLHWAQAFTVNAETAEEQEDLSQINFAELWFRCYLCPRHAFRRWARECPYLDKDIAATYRTQELPKYVWVVEIHSASKFKEDCTELSRLGEVVLDAGAGAKHGDGVLFVRLTHHILTESPVEGGLLVKDVDSMVFIENSNQSLGLLHPWVDEVLM